MLFQDQKGLVPQGATTGSREGGPNPKGKRACCLETSSTGRTKLCCLRAGPVCVKTRVPSSAPHEQGMWHTAVTSAPARRRQENRVSLDYMERRAAVKSMGCFSWCPGFILNTHVEAHNH